MSDAADRLARSRLAILDQIQHREHEQQPGDRERRREREPGGAKEREAEPRGARLGGWFARFTHAARTWWHHHPAHLGLELASPVLSAYAERKPLQYLGMAAAVGAVVMIARPWRLISVTGLLMAVAKSSQLSAVLLSALSAAEYQKERDPYE